MDEDDPFFDENDCTDLYEDDLEEHEKNEVFKDNALEKILETEDRLQDSDLFEDGELDESRHEQISREIDGIYDNDDWTDSDLEVL